MSTDTPSGDNRPSIVAANNKNNDNNLAADLDNIDIDLTDINEQLERQDHTIASPILQKWAEKCATTLYEPQHETTHTKWNELSKLSKNKSIKSRVTHLREFYPMAKAINRNLAGLNWTDEGMTISRPISHLYSNTIDPFIQPRENAPTPTKCSSPKTDQQAAPQTLIDLQSQHTTSTSTNLNHIKTTQDVPRYSETMMVSAAVSDMVARITENALDHHTDIDAIAEEAMKDTQACKDASKAAAKIATELLHKVKNIDHHADSKLAPIKRECTKAQQLSLQKVDVDDALQSIKFLLTECKKDKQTQGLTMDGDQAPAVNPTTAPSHASKWKNVTCVPPSPMLTTRNGIQNPCAKHKKTPPSIHNPYAKGPRPGHGFQPRHQHSEHPQWHDDKEGNYDDEEDQIFLPYIMMPALSTADHCYLVTTNAEKLSRSSYHAAMTFYSSLQTVVKNCGIGLIEFKDLTSDTEDYYVPTTVDLLTTKMQQFEWQEYAAFTVHNDGYQLLKTIMVSHVGRLQHPHTPLAYLKQTAQPSYNKTRTLFGYEMDLKMFYQSEESYNRLYTDAEKMATFLGGITGDTHFEATITEARKECPNEKHGIVPERYQLGNIAIAIASSSSKDPSVGINMSHPTRLHHILVRHLQMISPHAYAQQPRLEKNVNANHQDQMYSVKYVTFTDITQTAIFLDEKAKEISDAFCMKNRLETKVKIHAATVNLWKTFGMGREMNPNWTEDQDKAFDTLHNLLTNFSPQISTTEAYQTIEWNNPCMVEEFIDSSQCHPPTLQTLHMNVPPKYITDDKELDHWHNDLESVQDDDPPAAHMIFSFLDEVTQGDSGVNGGLTNAKDNLIDF
eukprot:jgi/Psemu1/27802/gm1.27802_g